MKNEIYFVRTAANLSEIEGLNYFDKRKSHEKLLVKLEKKCPITVFKQEYGQLLIYELILPIITNIKLSLNEEYIISIINQFNSWCKDYYFDGLVLENRLKPYKDFFRIETVNSKYLNLIYLDTILNEIELDSDFKEKKIGIVAFNPALTDYIINTLSDKFNDITIFAKDVDYYNDYSINFYQESGLLIQVKSIDYQKEIECDIIIDCDEQPNKLLYYYKKETTVLYAFLEDRLIYRNKSNRNDLQMVANISITNGEFDTSDFFARYLMTNNRGLKSLMRNLHELNDYYGIREYINQFDIKVDFTIL